MFTNVTYQIVNSINWWSNIFLGIQVLGSFLIAFFTIRYSQYLQEKKEFDNAMIWLATEGVFLQDLLKGLKNTIDEDIKEINALPDTKNISGCFFPDVTLNSLNFFISKGYFGLFTTDQIGYFLKLRLDVTQLKHNFDSYAQLNSVVSQITAENYNTQKMDTFVKIKTTIDEFNQHWSAYEILKYPKTFRQYFWP
jgi:hypothetical protein